MALDDALLDSHRHGLTPPTLRFYSWEPAALSIGYAQSLADVDVAACREAGLDVVRRPTGGRAVLHRGEFTYALIASEGFPPSVALTYRRITEVLADAISRLGAPAAVAPGQACRASTASCFQSATQADLQAMGRKLVGSAQKRRDGAFLQHGSLMLTQESTEILSLLTKRAQGHDAPAGKSDCAAGDLAAPAPEATCLAALLGHVPERAAIAHALTAAAEAAWGIELVPAPLTDWEIARARELMAFYQLEAAR